MSFVAHHGRDCQTSSNPRHTRTRKLYSWLDGLNLCHLGASSGLKKRNLLASRYLVKNDGTQNLQPNHNSNIRISNIHHRIPLWHRRLDAQNMSRSTIRLIRNRQIRKAASDVLSIVTAGIRNVVQLKIIADPAPTSLARVDKIHAISRREGKLAVRSLDNRAALFWRNKLVDGINGTTELCTARGSDAVLQVGVGVVADVVGTRRGVDLEKGDGAAVGGYPHAHVVAVDGAGPVGYSVDVDFAAENADGGGVLVVGSDADGFAASMGDCSGGGEGSG